MAGETSSKAERLGIWVGIGDLLLSLALLVAAFVMVRLDALPQLRTLAAEKAYFVEKPLLLDTYRHGYTFETVRDHLRALGADGRDYYAHTFIPIYDLAQSVILLTFMVLFILYATQPDKHHAIDLPSGFRKALLVVPVLQFLFDVGENFLLRSLADAFPHLEPGIADRASLYTQLKWICIFLDTMIMLGLGVYTLHRWLVRPKAA